MRKISLFILALSFLFAPLTYARDTAVKQAELHDVATLVKNGSEGTYIIDVRTPSEFRQGHIPGAINIDFFGAGFERAVDRLAKEKPVIVYCRTGRRAEAAAVQMTEQGMKNVSYMTQGMEEWQKRELPVEESR